MQASTDGRGGGGGGVSAAKQSTKPPSPSDAFSSAALTLLSSPIESATSSSVVELGGAGGGERGGGGVRTYGTTSFYHDPSGRARLHLRLRLGFPTRGARDAVLGSGCVRPAPKKSSSGGEEERAGDDGGNEAEGEDAESSAAGGGAKGKRKGEGGASALRFECRSVSDATGPGGQQPHPASMLAVEGVTVLSTRLDDGDDDYAIVFDVEVAVRAPPPYHRMFGGPYRAPPRRTHSAPDAILEEGEDGSSPAPNQASEDQQEAVVDWLYDEEGGGEATLSRLEIRAVLSRKKARRYPTGGRGGSADDGGGPNADPESVPKRNAAGLALGLLALELGAGVTTASSGPTSKSAKSNSNARGGGGGVGGGAAAAASSGTHYGTSLLSTSPVLLHLRLVSALTVTVQEVGGARAAMGATLLSVTVSHSDAHDEDVSVTNIALHPGHSRLWTPPPPAPQMAHHHPHQSVGGKGGMGMPGPPSMVQRGVSANAVLGGGVGGGGGGGGPVVHPQQQQAAALQQAYAARRAAAAAAAGGGGDDDATVATTASSSSAITGLPRAGMSIRTGGTAAGGGSSSAGGSTSAGGGSSAGGGGGGSSSAGVAGGTAATAAAAGGYGFYHPTYGFVSGYPPPYPPRPQIHGVSSVNPDGRSMQGGELSVLDMSRHVRWGFAHGTAPALPLVLRPREAFATVIQVDAGENLRNRTFVSPVAVTAVVGEATEAEDGGMEDVDLGGEEKTDEEEKEERKEKGEGEGEEPGYLHRPRPPVVVSTDARWTTARLAVEPADAFRVDMSLRESSCRVGAPVVVGLKVMNLSNETRDLMLLMAKDEESSRDKDAGLGRFSAPSSPSGPRGGGGGAGAGAGGGGNRGGLAGPFPHRNVRAAPRPFGAAAAAMAAAGGGGGAGAGGNIPREGAGGPVRGGGYYQGRPAPPPQPSHHHGVNTAVVSEVNGYTFGVWGLSGDDDGTTRHNRDHELLAVDAALLLGEVKGQHTIEAELRFVPLREGTLDVPNLKLYDKMGGRWYNCVHLLKIVAAAKV